MTKVFLGGSRKISRLDDAILKRLDRIIESRYPVLIGDANGADKEVQVYLHNRRYDLVEVFCSGVACRNNLGNWPVRPITASGNRKDFTYYEAKDIVMADEASIGFMIWDGQSLGTLMNVYRLVSQQKKVVLYNAPRKGFINLKTNTDLEQLISGSGSELRLRMKARTGMSEQHAIHTSQVGLL
jgi:hypothetical protein